jgi:hypothetical protein
VDMAIDGRFQTIAAEFVPRASVGLRSIAVESLLLLRARSNAPLVRFRSYVSDTSVHGGWPSMTDDDDIQTFVPFCLERSKAVSLCADFRQPISVPLMRTSLVGGLAWVVSCAGRTVSPLRQDSLQRWKYERLDLRHSNMCSHVFIRGLTSRIGPRRLYSPDDVNSISRICARM